MLGSLRLSVWETLSLLSDNLFLCNMEHYLNQVTLLEH